MSAPIGALARIGFWVLVALTVLLTAIHVVGVLAIADGEDERLMFVCYAALDALSLVVLLVPYRRGERWAWASSWIQVAATALVMPVVAPGTSEPSLGFSYLGIAVVMALCLAVAAPRRAGEPWKA